MLSTFPTLLPFLLFAFVASITPGPTNILVLSNSARFGFRAALPIIFGACASAALIVLAVGSGVGQTLAQLPLVQSLMKWAGVLWLSYLAWQIFRAPVTPVDDQREQPVQATFGLWAAASLQLVNPKTWMMALAVVSVFAGTGEDQQLQTVCLSLVFFLVSLPCLGIWALLGAGSSRWVRSASALKRFNQLMALLLLGSACLSLLA
ncbi:lysine transporter LysE [Pseudomonas prosekii]|uniref:Lysine transporter LysE n=1 Tax=Pseudomonas prosekii TaxID=1148509 RepID=A0A3L8CTT9_9PSED|nr:LysE family translocator [Pseudomonas prosekii]RLU11318.1 lysine transporter LysE [Pseudomonas prosekii]RLU14387.1 lysine transporter LysE [Pseudomonas prosekii]